MSRTHIVSKRNLEIAEDAKTMIASDIARKQKISRERVRQILLKMGVEAFRPPRKTTYYIQKPKRNIPCVECRTIMFTGRKEHSFCSKKCYDVNLRKIRPEYGRTHAKQWYQKYKDKDGFKELTRRRNAGERGLSIKDFVTQ